MRSALEWSRVRALAADGVAQREIARRLGINRRTVARLVASEEPPRYRRAAGGSQLDSLEPVLRRLLEEWPQIKAPRATELLREEYGYRGSVDVVKRRLRALRPPQARAAQRTGYRAGQVMQLDWAELPTRPKLLGRERRLYALVASLPYSGAQTAFFSLDMTIESFLEGHVRAFEWLGGVPRECVYDNLRSVVGRRAGDVVHWNRRFPLGVTEPHAPMPNDWTRGADLDRFDLITGPATHRKPPQMGRGDLVLFHAVIHVRLFAAAEILDNPQWKRHPVWELRWPHEQAYEPDSSYVRPSRRRRAAIAPF